MHDIKNFLQKNNLDVIEKKIKELSLILFKHFAFKSIENYIGCCFGRKDFRKNLC